MTRRSDRTTGLPRSKRRQGDEHTGPPSRLRLDERTARIVILSGSSALLAIVIVVMGMGWYHDRWGHGREVVLRVDSESVTLSYFADRLFDYSLRGSFGGLSPEIGLMTQLEDELVAVLLARESSIDLSDVAVDQQISSDLGIAIGGSGSQFDNAIRNQLRDSRMSLSTFRRKAEASAAETGLRELMLGAVGTTGELVTLRVVVVSDQETADSIFERIEGGENMGSIAQVESIDLVSRTEDGLRTAEPSSLMTPELQAVVDEAEAGVLLGPVNIDDVEFWVVRIEDRSDGEYSESHRQQLADDRFDAALDERRALADVERTADSGDYDWATSKAVN